MRVQVQCSLYNMITQKNNNKRMVCTVKQMKQKHDTNCEHFSLHSTNNLIEL